MTIFGRLLLCLGLGLWPDSLLAENKNDLVLLTWPDYMDLDLLQTFEQETGVHVRMVHYETDETRDELLAETRGGGFDVANITCDRVEGYHKQGWLAPMETTLVPNVKHVEPRWMEAYPAANSHAVPYLWGTLGIAYRPDLVEHPLTTWRELLQPADSLRQHILMEKDSRNLAGMAMKASGFAWNSNKEPEIRTAMAMLMAQKPFVKEYGYPSLDAHSGLVTGKIWAATLYNGDAVTLQAFEPRIRYVVPQEGALLWMDCLAVMEKSQHKTMAYAFINFIHDPKHAAQLANTLHYATTNGAARAFLPSEHLNNPVIYPPEDVLARSEFKFTENLSARLESRFKSLLNSLLQ